MFRAVRGFRPYRYGLGSCRNAGQFWYGICVRAYVWRQNRVYFFIHKKYIRNTQISILRLLNAIDSMILFINGSIGWFFLTCSKASCMRDNIAYIKPQNHSFPIIMSPSIVSTQKNKAFIPKFISRLYKLWDKQQLNLWSPRSWYQS